MLKIIPKLLFIWLFFTFVSTAQASDLAKEKRWAEQISDAILTGEVIWLPKKSGNFLAIYTENEGDNSLGAVILLHGTGVHPDWVDVIHPLRTALPEHGWSTLSLQMPILANDKKFRDYIPLLDEVPERIDAAIKFLEQKKIYNIVIMAHSMGTVMGAHYLANTSNKSIRAYVGISMATIEPVASVGNKPPDNTKMNSPAGTIDALRNIKIPTLDIYGSEDVPIITRSARARKNIAKKGGNAHYYQVELKGADHFYRGYETPLIKRIRSWMKRYASGSEIKLN